VLGLFGYYTWQKPSGLASLFQSESSFGRSAELASLYGVAAWDGVSEPPVFVAGQRPGLLTRALFLSTGSPNTRPIMKGVFIRKNILCDAIPPPPPGANAKPPELEPGMTTRETVEELTETPGTVCAGCHAALINALGFATESFDALGRYRTEQRFFDASGSPTGSKPVVTSGVPHVTAVETPAAGAADLMQQILASGKVEACLSRNFFRYTFARWEDPELDGCALEGMRKSLENGGTLVDLVMAAALDGSFRQRAFE
jgi:predicted nucleic acid-binding Zn ribbon protein